MIVYARPCTCPDKHIWKGENSGLPPEVVAGSDHPYVRAVEDAITQMTLRIRRAYWRLRDAITPDAAAAALRSGDIQHLLAELPEGVFRDELASAFDVASNLALDIGTQAATAGISVDDVSGSGGGSGVVGSGSSASSGGGAEIHWHFDRLNPRTLDAVRQDRDRVLSDLSESVRTNVREIITRSLSLGNGPDETARLIRSEITLTPAQRGWVDSYRSALETGDRNALNRALRDKRSDGVVERALASDGKPLKPDRIDSLVQRYADRALAYRAKTIARTESIRAAALGNHASYQQAIRRGDYPEAAIVKHWLIAPEDGKVCPICRSIVLMNRKGVGFTEAFDSIIGPVYFPTDTHPNCRCVLTYRLDPRKL